MNDPQDESIAAIQNLLTQLQEATTNTGGSYAFFRMPLPEGESLVARIQQYLIESRANQEIPRNTSISEDIARQTITLMITSLPSPRCG